MVKKINLQLNPMPKRMAELIHSNRFLKIFSLLSLVLLIFSLTAIILLSTKKPQIIAFDLNGEKISEELPKAEKMIERAIREYIKHRYEWEPKEVTEKLKKAKSFITKKQESNYLKSISKVAKFSMNKKVHQRVFPTNINVDIKEKIAHIRGERITSIMGIKAAGSLNLKLHFTNGSHTERTPGEFISPVRRNSFKK